MAPLDPRTMERIAEGFAFLFAANIGSFLNVVAHRVPLGLSVVRPRSRCPACRTPVRAVDNIPMVSWMMLGGRCRGCKGGISIRYAAVEALTGLAAAYAVDVLVFSSRGPVTEAGPWGHALAVFAVSAALLAAALIDIDHRILPDSITIPGMWLGPLLAAAVPELVLWPASLAQWTSDLLPAGCPERVVAAVVSIAGIAFGAGLIWSLGVVGSRVFGKEAMGFGDVKYLGMIGGVVGPVGALVALVAAAFVGSLAGFVRLLLTRDRYIPFGPFLAIGAYFAMVHGRGFVGWYLSHFAGPGAR